jgi:hypothetical protein
MRGRFPGPVGGQWGPPLGQCAWSSVGSTCMHARRGAPPGGRGHSAPAVAGPRPRQLCARTTGPPGALTPPASTTRMRALGPSRPLMHTRPRGGIGPLGAPGLTRWQGRLEQPPLAAGWAELRQQKAQQRKKGTAAAQMAPHRALYAPRRQGRPPDSSSSAAPQRRCAIGFARGCEVARRPETGCRTPTCAMGPE